MPRHALIFTVLIMLSHPAIAEPHAILDTEKLPKPGETLVWSPLFQASWEKMQSLHAGKMEKVDPPNALISQLEEFQWQREDVMPKDGYAVFAGPSTPEFAKTTAEKIKEQFGVDMTPSRLPTTPDANAIYGILLRDLNFRKQFFRSRKKPLEFKDRLSHVHKVQFFGTVGKHSSHFGNNVKVLDYNDRGKSFILSIATDQADEKLILYRAGRALSFKMAIEHVKASIKAPLSGPNGSLADSTLHKNDTIKIPYLALKSDTDLATQLQGKRHYVGDPVPWTINIAYQITHFELFEKGARIRVETSHDDDPFGGIPARPRRITYVPRQFICDEPFFVFAWRDKASLPYFAAWIDGKEALQKFTK